MTMNRSERWLAAADRVQRLQLWIAALALVALMLVTVTDVVLRYLFNRPVRGSYDFVESALLIFVFYGAAASFFSRRHIVIDLIDAMVGARATAVLIRLADLLAVMCLALLIWAMFTPALQAYAYGDMKLELRLPIYLLWIAALLGLAGTLFCAAVAFAARPAAAGHEPGERSRQ
jgi:TRAP-type C4-dicarboxylate transport system permease small subunit